ncbi:MAG TPA: diacylglycerol kinase [Pseudomonadales bacterium]|nr:diacylglycerol kinase [Pseudomonadales bacterium]
MKPETMAPATPCKPGRKGLARLVAATGYSWAGFQQAWQHEAAFREELLLLLLLAPTSFWLGQTAAETAILLISCLVVLITELLNSAVEAVVDLASPTIHPLAARAKDIGSAAVFVALMQVLLVWGLIGWSRFFN